MTNQIADIVLGPIVWSTPPYSFGTISRIRRKIYCLLHANKIRMFYLGMLAADTQLPEVTKRGYAVWLHRLPWHKVLDSTQSRAAWLRDVDQEADPIHISLKEDYGRLLRSYQNGHDPKGPHIV